MLSLVITDVLDETHTLRIVGYCSVRSVTLSPVPSVRGFPLLSEVFHLPLVFYLWVVVFFSLFPPYLSFTALGFSKNSPAPWCEWAIVLCEQICRWVIDRVHTLNVASIGLHFLRVLLLKRHRQQKKQTGWTWEMRQNFGAHREETYRHGFGWRGVGLLARPGKRGVYEPVQWQNIKKKIPIHFTDHLLFHLETGLTSTLVSSVQTMQPLPETWWLQQHKRCRSKDWHLRLKRVKTKICQIHWTYIVAGQFEAGIFTTTSSRSLLDAHFAKIQTYQRHHLECSAK